MTVYADILMLINFVVDYFLISIACRFLHTKPRLWRLLLSSCAGGIFSLYIFLPQTSIALELTVHILMCGVLCFIAIGFKGIKAFLRSIAVFFCVNFAYSGAMIAVWLVFKPYGMVIKNSVVYFNISPIFLIAFSTIGYFGVVLIRKIFKKPFEQNCYCDVTVFCASKKLTLHGLADTGNCISDVFGTSQIFIADKNVIAIILGDEILNPARFRFVPCSTVAGEQLLNGYRIDRAEIVFNNKTHYFKHPILAESKSPLNECEIIINPETLI